jgi:hypothetical protein
MELSKIGFISKSSANALGANSSNGAAATKVSAAIPVRAFKGMSAIIFVRRLRKIRSSLASAGGRDDPQKRTDQYANGANEFDFMTVPPLDGNAADALLRLGALTSSAPASPSPC